MCGVLGLVINNFSEEKHGELVRNLFRESMIRGKHATGVSFVKNSKIHTRKHSTPADVWIRHQDLNSWVNEDGNLYCVGHIRYSTSDLKYNQPMATDSIAIVHNGVITQEPRSTWEEKFGFKTCTANDSELILRAMENYCNPLTYFYPASMAVCSISADKKLVAFRNEARPLYWAASCDGYVFASTEDILRRAGWPTMSFKTDPFVIYTVDKNNFLTYTVESNIEDLQ